MRGVSRHWWATAPAAVALAGAAVVAAQPYLSLRPFRGVIINPVTGPVGAVPAERLALAPAGSPTHAGGSGGGSARGANVASVPVGGQVGGAVGAAHSGAARSGSASSPAAAAAITRRIAVTPSMPAVGSTEAVSSFGRYASTALPLGAAAAFALLADSPDAFEPTSSAATARADVLLRAAVAPGSVAMVSVAPVEPTYDVAAGRVILASPSADETPATSGGVVTDGARLAATPWQLEAAGDDQIATLEATFPGAPSLLPRGLGGAFDHVLAGEVSIDGQAFSPVAVAPALAPSAEELVILANPEPTTIVLVAGGLLLLVGSARRKRAA